MVMFQCIDSYISVYWWLCSSVLMFVFWYIGGYVAVYWWLCSHVLAVIFPWICSSPVP